MNYYNENDLKAAQWLRDLIWVGAIPDGEVDTRSIEDITPNDLNGFTQCHFFAGIGGWPLALALSGWPTTRPVWTGSCPCQPFSQSGKGAGFADERHLWPAFYHLIQQLRPAVVFGEQVAGPDGLVWFDLVQTDLEVSGYATGALDICAAGVGAPHIRQRLYWVGDADGGGRPSRSGDGSTTRHRAPAAPASCGGSGLVNANMSDAARQRPFSVPVEPQQKTDRRREPNPWAQWELIGCADSRARPIEPGTFPLAHGVSGRVGLLRGYGNAIVPQVAAEFIGAYLDTI